MKSIAAALVSSSMVSMRLRLSGPVSSMVCLPTRAQVRLHRWDRRLSSFGLEYAARRVCTHVCGVIFWPVRTLGLFLGIKVIEVAEELVEAMHCRQKFVPVAKVVLAELACRIAEGFERLGDGDVSRLKSDRRAGNANLGQAGALGAAR